jgi:hypothetical protein
MSFIRELRESLERANKERSRPPAWLSRVPQVQGVIGRDGVERVTHRDLLIALDAPIQRGVAFRRMLEGAMRKQGWAPARFFGAVQRATGCKRGWARRAPALPAEISPVQLDGGMD